MKYRKWRHNSIGYLERNNMEGGKHHDWKKTQPQESGKLGA
jgi:hypothetical protein